MLLLFFSNSITELLTVPLNIITTIYLLYIIHIYIYIIIIFNLSRNFSNIQVMNYIENRNVI